jgi:hypothetical protein
VLRDGGSLDPPAEISYTLILIFPRLSVPSSISSVSLGYPLCLCPSTLPSPPVSHPHTFCYEEKNFLIVFTLCYPPGDARNNFNGIGALTYFHHILSGPKETRADTSQCTHSQDLTPSMHLHPRHSIIASAKSDSRQIYLPVSGCVG